ncbi:alpha/beta hydrolase [Paenibacillus sp. J5C_2022]|uniref:alpha/beta hydrolase n=1 Tax=Paenibacillus sp. J5C2022 TaxID=2977129 RepID=UPI0021CFC4CB|nr:alpha/beta hydrolase [Paenibacillus sp. J5C2022]MCU6708899.1 alpha/beta hydrolase [Paenibacillus sp. J5C2022]
MELTTLYVDEPLVLKRAVDIAKPSGAAKSTALFYVHGGGWNGGSRDQFHSHLAYFSSRGYWCGSAGYRLAPAADWKQQLSDASEAYMAFLHDLECQGQPVQRVIVLGSSAGAHLASLLAMMPPDRLPVQRTDRHAVWRQPDACVSINGPGTLEEWPDMNERIRDCIEQAVGCSYADSDRGEAFAEASPIAYVGQGCPSFLFLLAEHEQYFPHAHVYAMSESIRRHGGAAETVLIEGAEHGFFYGLTSPEQRQALRVLEAWLERQHV